MRSRRERLPSAALIIFAVLFALLCNIGPAFSIDLPIRIDITDRQPPVNPLTALDIFFTVAQTAIMVMIIGWIILFIRKKIEKALRPTPYDAAVKELGVLKAALAKRSMSKQEYCARISAMLKRYARESLPTALYEPTTAEFLKELQAIAAVSDEARSSIRDMLSFCDGVKFSGYDPSDAELEANVNSAEKILAGLHAGKTNTEALDKA